MTAGGVKLRLCPFCGSENVRTFTGGCVCVICEDCGASGPSVDPYYGYEVTEDNIDALQEDGRKLAASKWNLRPWEGNFWPEDLERMDEKMEQEADI